MMNNNNQLSSFHLSCTNVQKLQQRQQQYRRQQQDHQHRRYFISFLLGTTFVPVILQQLLHLITEVLPYVPNQSYGNQQQFQQQRLSSSFFLFVTSEPYVLLKSKAPKCFQVVSPRSPKAIVEFKAPDVVLVKDDVTSDGGNSEDIRRQLPQRAAAVTNSQRLAELGLVNAGDGLDSMYNKRIHLNQMEALKKSHMKDITITVSPRTIDGTMIKDTRIGNDGQPLPRKVRYQVEELFGSFEINLDPNDEMLEICVQSYVASEETPSRVYVTIVETDQSIYQIVYEKKKRQLENRMTENYDVLETHTSRISAELMRLKRRSESIVMEIDFSKQREKEFHNLSIELNSAVQYYTIARVCIIAMAGCIQVWYVIEYMKSKHIY